MVYKRIVAIVVSILFIFATACNLAIASNTGGGPTQNPQDLVNQAVQQTFQAQTQVAQAVQQTLAAMATNTSQFTVTPSLTPQPTLTMTPEIPLVHVTTDTNCRKGPGLVYDIVEGLLVGEQAEVVGVDPDHAFWYIRNTGAPTGFCWVGGLYATVVGNTAALPILTPLPTPVAAKFTASYNSLITCGGQYAFNFNISNTGTMVLESVKIDMIDNITATTTTNTSDVFRSFNGCVQDVNQADLAPGESGPVSNVNPGQINYNPTGHSITAKITICTANGLGGVCASKTLNFTP
jgi:hypothetical protein